LAVCPLETEDADLAARILLDAPVNLD